MKTEQEIYEYIMKSIGSPYGEQYFQPPTYQAFIRSIYELGFKDGNEYAFPDEDEPYSGN